MSQSFPTDPPPSAAATQHWRAVPTLKGIPDATVARLPVYLRALNQLAEQRIDTISSGALAEAAGVNSAQLRKDLSYLGSYGTRGVGYDVDVPAIPDRPRGRLGARLAGDHRRARQSRYRAGQLLRLLLPRVSGRRPDRHLSRSGGQADSWAGHLRPHRTRRRRGQDRAVIAVIATPADAAQAVADRLVYLGVTSILNFAPTVLVVPERRQRPQGRPRPGTADPRLPRAAQERRQPDLGREQEDQLMSILVVSVSHKSTSVSHLAQLALDAAASAKLAEQLVGSEHIDEAVVLVHLQPHRAVCVGLPGFHGALDDAIEALADIAGLRPGELRSLCAVFFDEGAVAHTFSVASGLDSLVVGESQILGQVRNALTLGQTHETVGTVLNSLFQQAIRVGKRVHTETGIGAAGRSLVSAAYGS